MEKYEIITDFFEAELDDSYSLFIDSNTRQIEGLLVIQEFII